MRSQFFWTGLFRQFCKLFQSETITLPIAKMNDTNTRFLKDDLVRATLIWSTNDRRMPVWTSDVGCWSSWYSFRRLAYIMLLPLTHAMVQTARTYEDMVNCAKHLPPPSGRDEAIEIEHRTLRVLEDKCSWQLSSESTPALSAIVDGGEG